MISLKKAGLADCETIHGMQRAAFKALLDKYQDRETNPGAESYEDIRRRMQQEHTDYYFIVLDEQPIGAIRVVRLANGIHKIAPMFILPAFQGKGFAQEAIRLAEGNYPNGAKWKLDTIKQEGKLCHLYEKMGYIATGQEEEIKEDMTLKFYEKSLN